MQSSVVDLAQLNRYTGGDENLNAEILKLFRDQSATLLSQLPSILTKRDARAWRQTLHTLKGAARGVGAFSLADSSASAETIQPEAQSAGAALQRLETEAEAVRHYIDNLLAQHAA